MVPLPVIVQLYESIPEGAVYSVDVPFATGITGEILQDKSDTVTRYVQNEVQPNRLMLSVKVKVPVAPAVTVTSDPVFNPVIIPLPETDQACVILSKGFTVLVKVLFVEPGRTWAGPDRVQDGMALIVNEKVAELVLLHSGWDGFR
jgi:hypothetical protein